MIEFDQNGWQRRLKMKIGTADAAMGHIGLCIRAQRPCTRGWAGCLQDKMRKLPWDNRHGRHARR